MNKTSFSRYLKVKATKAAINGFIFLFLRRKFYLYRRIHIYKISDTLYYPVAPLVHSMLEKVEDAYNQECVCRIEMRSISLLSPYTRWGSARKKQTLPLLEYISNSLLCEWGNNWLVYRPDGRALFRIRLLP